MSCNTTEPPPPNDEKPTLALKLEDVSCTEVWIELTTTNLPLPATISLKQTNPNGDTKSQILNLNTKDSLLYIDSLLPNQTYKYKVSSIQQQVSSNELSVTTLDTTTHNFSIEVLEFGDGFESSYFNDVWIFSETNIWVCGYIYEPTFGRKNIMHWNGNIWKPLGIQFNSSGIDGIWAQDSSKIYFAAGFIIKYENGTFTEISLGNIGLQNGQRVEKLWGSSESNIYGVGPWGTIVRFNGSVWTKIEFDTQWYFYEITGNKETGAAYAVARNTNFSCVIVELNNSLPKIIYNSDNSLRHLKSYDVDFLHKDVLILSDIDIWKFKIETHVDEIVEDLTSGYYLPRLTSSASNDVYFFGNKQQEGERLLHYNGFRITAFDLPSRGYVIYGGAHSINNLAAMAAYSDNKAYLILIRR